VVALNNVGKLHDPGIEEEAAKLYIEGEMLRLLSMRSLSDRINARRPGPEAAVGKMINTPHTQRVFQLALKVNGHKGMVADELQFTADSPQGEGRGSWTYGPWFSPALTLMVGTTEIMRNVVGERVLGLPRDLDPSAKGDWSQQVQNRAPARAA
jgi:alkylation response protein AidB-like acyl-CoA dehydrogenase